mmetsp:Transcript_23627/g.36454  ORF Transcript_23627/g.36454 Transcript_23627/m.36454 type:complete len:348 (-) Transcript_23627:125-1168(-)|eukprot:CAMPEP_0196802946 /NCGR_PEP_ID=MMETSP1362-20130617/2444_1 /TAXON_ID=163516 /ORGANISM="Leptocylindrus danicus, Strain CCMP1856" /LENGTH=347 /DNA_ID=CAMNT_0042174367 /DNA_START=99 /DNA_END=1142 /DNA_ORIENTATION=+
MMKRDTLLFALHVLSICIPTAVSFLTNNAAPILKSNKARADYCSSSRPPLTQCNALFTASNYWLFTGQVFNKYRQQFERENGGDPYTYDRMKYLESMLRSAVPGGDILNYERNFRRNRGSFRQNYTNNFNNYDNGFDRRGYDSSSRGGSSGYYDRNGGYNNRGYNNQQNYNGGGPYDNNGRGRNLLQRSGGGGNGNNNYYEDYERQRDQYRRERYDNRYMDGNYNNNNSNGRMNMNDNGGYYNDRGSGASYDYDRSMRSSYSRGGRSFYNNEKNPSNNNTFYNSSNNFSNSYNNRMSYGGNDPNFGSLSLAPPGMSTFNNQSGMGPPTTTTGRNYGGTYPYNMSRGN